MRRDRKRRRDRLCFVHNGDPFAKVAFQVGKEGPDDMAGEEGYNGGGALVFCVGSVVVLRVGVEDEG